MPQSRFFGGVTPQSHLFGQPDLDRRFARFAEDGWRLLRAVEAADPAAAARNRARNAEVARERAAQARQDAEDAEKWRALERSVHAEYDEIPEPSPPRPAFGVAWRAPRKEDTSGNEG